MITRRRRRVQEGSRVNPIATQIVESLSRMTIGPIENIPHSIEDEIRLTAVRWLPGLIDVQSLAPLFDGYNTQYEESTDLINTEHLRIGDNPMYKQRIGIDDSLSIPGWNIRVARSIEYLPSTDEHYTLLGLNQDNQDINIVRSKKRLVVDVRMAKIMITQVIQRGSRPRIEFEIELGDRDREESLTEALSVFQRVTEIIRRLQRQITTWIGSGRDWLGTFFGALPVAYRNKNMEQIKSQRYFVQVKLDGVRYIAINFENRLWYIGRSDGLILSTLEALPNVKYMIDCEVTHGLLMAFDMLAIDNRSLMNLPYSSRYNSLNELVLGLEDSQPFIDINPTLPVYAIRELTDNIDVKSKTYLVDDELPIFETDGLIFQHDGPYVQGLDSNVFKWKFPDLLSIDCVTEDDSIMVQGPRGVIQFSDRISDVYDTVGEYVYNTQTSIWERIRERPDKTQPNFITTAFDVLESMMEDVTLNKILTQLQE